MAATQRASDSSTSPRFSAPRLPSISIPNPDIFSDDYALEPLHDSANSSPVSPVESDDETAPVNVFSTPRASVDIDPSRSNASTRSHRPISTLKRPREGQNGIPNRVVSMLSQAESGTHRTSSSSSRMSIPRSQSPYVGASGPSHPYGMYPQVTRTSSIASGSTVRPEERGFITPTGPEHPYSMYPQTTLPEDDVATQPLSIPLGFPGMGQQYHQRTRRADNDVADLVGADGHVEQLPPYTRYPEGIAPKEPPTHIDMPVIGATVDRNVDAMSPQSATTQHDDGQAVWNVAAARTASSESDGSLKERWKEKGRRRVLCGLPLWLVLVLLAVMLLIGAIGGVIGGVVGRKKDSSSQPAPLPDSTSPTAAVTVTETSWIDASPLPTTTGTPNIPIGTWNIPTTNTNLSSNSCVQNPSQAFTWGCMPPGGIGVDIVPWGPFYQIQFDTYPLNGTVQYGTQPPDLGTGLNDLLPYMDKVASNLGPSLFFYTLYDKLTVVPEWALSISSKRSLSLRDIESRDDGNGGYAVAGDKPWFCWFNQTAFEFFIYVNDNTTQTDATPAMSTSWPFQNTYISYQPTSVVNAGLMTLATVTNMPPWASSQPTPTPASKDKRQGLDKREWWYNPRDNYVNYPNVVKMQEKRIPNVGQPAYVQPYCLQMQILDDGEIVPAEGSPTVTVPENEPSGNDPVKRSSDDGSTAQLDSDCVCEWLVTT